MMIIILINVIVPTSFRTTAESLTTRVVNNDIMRETAMQKSSVYGVQFGMHLFSLFGGMLLQF